MYNDSIVQAASSRLNNTMRWNRGDPKKVNDARNALLAARLERAVHEALHPTEDGFRKLAKADRERLAAMLLRG